MDMNKKMTDLILELYRVKVVKFGNFKLKSGIDSPIYLDLRIVISYPKLMDSLTELLVNLLENSDIGRPDSVCGVPYTALPMATLLSAKTGIPMLMRRKESKDHGLRKTIEGEFQKGDKCIVVDDVVSSGISIIETIEDLVSVGLKVKNAVVVLDREQGGVKNLKERGIKIHFLTSISKVLEVLYAHEKINEQTYQEVTQYIADNKVSIIYGAPHTSKGPGKNRLTMSFSERASLTTNKLAEKIFKLMEFKKTLLCVAADVTKSSELLKLACQVGPHICIFKTHFDALEDFSKETCMELMRIAKNFNFLIMEDRKFSDIGNTVIIQYNQVKPWAELVTAHSLCGESIIKAMKSCVDGDEEKGCFLVGELSCEGHLISKEYTTETLKIAVTYSDFVVGLVCQSAHVIKLPNLIQLTPGVSLKKSSDNFGQNYNDPELVVLEKGADIAVVGRGIIQASDPEETSRIYKEKLWSAYQKRVTYL